MSAANQIAIEGNEKVLASMKKDLAEYEASPQSAYRDSQIAELNRVIAKREAKLAELKKGN